MLIGLRKIICPSVNWTSTESDRPKCSRMSLVRTSARLFPVFTSCLFMFILYHNDGQTRGPHRIGQTRIHPRAMRKERMTGSHRPRSPSQTETIWSRDAGGTPALRVAELPDADHVSDFAWHLQVLVPPAEDFAKAVQPQIWGAASGHAVGGV